MGGLWGAVVVVIVVGGCAGAPARVPLAELLPTGSCEELRSFFTADLEPYQDAVDAAAKVYQEEQWRVETADPKASEERLSELFAAYQRATYDKALVLRARAVGERVKELSAASCPWKGKFDRALRLLHNSILTADEVIAQEKANQDRQDALAKASNGFRLTVEGETEPISKALFAKKLIGTDDRAERERLYRAHGASRARRWLEWGFRDLLKGRNAEARLARFKDFAEYRFHRAGLDLDGFRRMTGALKAKLAPKVRAEMRRLAPRYGIKKIEAWDLPYLRHKSAAGAVDVLLKPLPADSALGIARRFYASLGIDIDSYGFQTDLYPRAGKNTHAFAMSVVFPRVDGEGRRLAVPKSDVRFLANLRQPVKWDDASTIIHELGHAIHADEVRQPVGLFRSTESVPTEAIAMTLERMADTPAFLTEALTEVAKAPPEKIVAALTDRDKAVRLEQAFTLLRQTFFSEFERAVYADPDADFGKLWSRLHEEYWGVTVPPDLADWDVEHFVMAPVYVQNYALGVLMVEQLYDAFRKGGGPDPRSPKLGERLKAEFFAPGQEYDYLDLTRRLSGKPLSADAALRLL